MEEKERVYSIRVSWEKRIISFEKELHSEIDRIELFDTLPEKWTYPQIQPLLVREYERRKQ